MWSVQTFSLPVRRLLDGHLSEDRVVSDNLGGCIVNTVHRDNLPSQTQRYT